MDEEDDIICKKKFGRFQFRIKKSVRKKKHPKTLKVRNIYNTFFYVRHLMYSGPIYIIAIALG